MYYSVVLPCAGSGTRMGLGYNKLLYKKNDKTIIEMTVDVFLQDPRCNKIILVIQKNDEEMMHKLFEGKPVTFVYGGASRAESVYAGIKLVTSSYTMIHDGARPYLSKELLNVLVEVVEQHDVVAPFVKSKDAIRSLDKEGQKYASNMVLVQTPQVAKTSILKEAFKKASHLRLLDTFKDDISLIEAMLQISPYLVNGDYANIKITTIEDLR